MAIQRANRPAVTAAAGPTHLRQPKRSRANVPITCFVPRELPHSERYRGFRQLRGLGKVHHIQDLHSDFRMCEWGREGHPGIYPSSA